VAVLTAQSLADAQSRAVGQHGPDIQPGPEPITEEFIRSGGRRGSRQPGGLPSVHPNRRRRAPVSRIA
jgi:hypothetical protein